MMTGINGMGLYPDDPCYDPTRSTLLPFWLDNWTEGVCKYNRILGGVNSTVTVDGTVAVPGTPSSTQSDIASLVTTFIGMGILYAAVLVVSGIYAARR